MENWEAIRTRPWDVEYDPGQAAMAMPGRRRPFADIVHCGRW